MEMKAGAQGTGYEWLLTPLQGCHIHIHEIPFLKKTPFYICIYKTIRYKSVIEKRREI